MRSIKDITMTEEAVAPPEPKITHYERRNNVMLAVFDVGPAQTHKVCESINEAKRLSVSLQKSGKVVKVDKECQNVHKPVRRHKVVTKAQSVKKTLRAGPRMTEDEGKALERHLLKNSKVAR
jgi:hypothetical protein